MEAIISNVQLPWYLIDTASPEIVYWYEVKSAPSGTLVSGWEVQRRWNECMNVHAGEHHLGQHPP